MMKVRTFRAGSMPQALAQVKRDLGPDAVIVNTRTFKQGGLFGLGRQRIIEISARRAPGSPYESRRSDLVGQRINRAYGEHSPQKPHGKLNAAAGAQPQQAAVQNVGLDEDLKREIGNIKDLVENLVKEQRRMHGPNMPEQLFEMYLNLIQQEVADELARELLEEVQRELTTSQLESGQLVKLKLAEVVEKMVSTTGPVCCNLNGQPRTVALIGPTGVGKTTTIAKLAAHYTLRQNKKVGLITIDTYRIGAVDQLRMYAQIIDVPLKVVLTPAELKEAVILMEDRDVIFIDTAGRSQNDSIKMKELAMFLNAVKPDEVHLVLSSTGQHS
ncbi:MAG: flagellar biosynthesis protein FlhF, partial [Planctomycetes bacterium]|nr:flagellar biosynthesis protein FlhF [Planctomycetota bacterium]